MHLLNFKIFLSEIIIREIVVTPNINVVICPGIQHRNLLPASLLGDSKNRCVCFVIAV